MGKSGYRQKQKEVSGLSYPENAALQLSVAEASRFTGYHHNTLTNWCHNGYIRYFEISGGYMIPKSCLLNFLLSPHILDSYRPSKKLVDLAKEFSRQGKSTKKPTAK